MAGRDRNEILRSNYADILRMKLFSEADLTETLTENEILYLFEEINAYFGTQTTKKRVKEHITRMINQLSEGILDGK